MKYGFILLGLFLAGCSGKPVAGTEPNKSPASSSPPAATATAKDAEKKAEPAASANSARVTCKQGSDERVIETLTKGSGCEVSYSKFGETASVASSVNGMDHCTSVQERMKANLEKSGFTCS